MWLGFELGFYFRAHDVSSVSYSSKNGKRREHAFISQHVGAFRRSRSGRTRNSGRGDLDLWARRPFKAPEQMIAEVNALFLHVPSSREMPSAESRRLKWSPGALPPPPRSHLSMCTTTWPYLSQELSSYIFVEEQGEAVGLASQGGAQSTFSRRKHILLEAWALVCRTSTGSTVG